MNRYEKSDLIKINLEENVIRFSASTKKRECDHREIQISVEDNEVLCLDCNKRLNPVWWIKSYLQVINASAKRNNRVLAECREIERKLEKKNKFMCKSCHEVNTIDFHKLPSKAAVERGIAVVKSDYLDDGVTVEID